MRGASGPPPANGGGGDVVPLFRTPPKRVACKTPGCGQVLSNERAADGYQRCSACVDRFARSTPKRIDPKLAQGTLFEVNKAAARAGIPQITGRQPPALPPVPPPPVLTAADHTAAHVAKLNTARERADHDPKAARVVELTRGGKSLAEAIQQTEEEFAS